MTPPPVLSSKRIGPEGQQTGGGVTPPPVLSSKRIGPEGQQTGGGVTPPATQGRLIIISAPSGTGKTSVIQRLLKRYPQMIHSVSWTTRAKRPQEADGKDYHFVAEADFKKGIQENAFAEWAQVHSAYYGTPQAALEKWLKEKREVLLDLDVNGAMNLKKLFGQQALTIFLLPPSEQELERRLSERKTDSLEERQVRLKNAQKELAQKALYDHQVVNENLDQACLEIEGILRYSG